MISSANLNFGGSSGSGFPADGFASAAGMVAPAAAGAAGFDAGGAVFAGGFGDRGVVACCGFLATSGATGILGTVSVGSKFLSAAAVASLQPRTVFWRPALASSPQAQWVPLLATAQVQLPWQSVLSAELRAPSVSAAVLPCLLARLACRLETCRIFRPQP